MVYRKWEKQDFDLFLQKCKSTINIYLCSVTLNKTKKEMKWIFGLCFMYLIECSIGYKMKIQSSIRILVIQYISWKLFFNLLIYIHLVLILNGKYKFHNIHLLTHWIIVIKYVFIIINIIINEINIFIDWIVLLFFFHCQIIFLEKTFLFDYKYHINKHSCMHI